MAHPPRSLRELAIEVAEVARRTCPGSQIELIGLDRGDDVGLFIDRHFVDLENLMRTLKLEDPPDGGVEEMERFLEVLLDPCAINIDGLSFDEAKARIMPRIHSEHFFRSVNRAGVAHVPFVNDTAIVFVLDSPHTVTSIRTQQMKEWGKTEEDLLQLALDNLDLYAYNTNIINLTSAEGASSAIIRLDDGYDSERLLLPSLQARLRGMMGGDFQVVIPARGMMVAMDCSRKGFLSRMHTKAAEDFRRLPYPITDKPFLVTRDGIAGLGETEPRLSGPC